MQKLRLAFHLLGHPSKVGASCSFLQLLVGAVLLEFLSAYLSEVVCGRQDHKRTFLSQLSLLAGAEEALGALFL